MIKKYNTKLIKKYIEDHKDDIYIVSCGLKENWSGTSRIVYKDGKFDTDYDWDNKYLRIASIESTNWGTPVMYVERKNGQKEVIECYK